METRFRIRQGDFEVELSGPREFVEAQLDAHLAAWLARGDAAMAGREAKAMTLTTRALPPLDTDSASPQEGDTKKIDFPRVAPDFKPKVNVTIDAFLAMKQAVAPADIVVVAVYYLDKYLQKDTFVPADLQELLAPLEAWSCRQATDELEAVIAMGFVERLREGRFTITYKGQNYVRDGLTP